MLNSVKDFFNRPANDARARALTQKELCDCLGITRATANSWQRKGLPYVARQGSGGHEYRLPVVAQWLARRSKAGHEESAVNQLARARTTLIEMKIAARRLEVVRPADAEEAWRRLVTAARAGLMRVLDLAPILDASPGIEEKREILDTRIREILTELAAGSWLDDDPAVPEVVDSV